MDSLHSHSNGEKLKLCCMVILWIYFEWGDKRKLLLKSICPFSWSHPIASWRNTTPPQKKKGTNRRNPKGKHHRLHLLNCYLEKCEKKVYETSFIGFFSNFIISQWGEWKSSKIVFFILWVFFFLQKKLIILSVFADFEGLLQRKIQLMLK